MKGAARAPFFIGSKGSIAHFSYIQPIDKGRLFLLSLVNFLIKV